MVFSASSIMAVKHGDGFYYLKRHLFFLVLGFGALIYARHVDLNYLKDKAYALVGISLLLLLAVFIPGVGRKVLGASRWIDLGILSFQPSEFIKITMVIALAKWLSDNKTKLCDVWRGFFPPVAFLGFVLLLIMCQPDLGTAITIGATVFVMLFVAGVQLWPLIGLGLLATIGVVVISFVTPYRLRRLTSYLDPWNDPQGAGFQIIQSLLAVGSGGLMGLGLGASRQKYFYLPQQFTDFIFAIMCEELGFFGGLMVVTLFCYFAYTGFRIALSTNDNFRTLLATGLVIWLSLQALINIMVVVGLIPTTGIPLPFISYGGTSTFVNLLAVGLILNVGRKNA